MTGTPRLKKILTRGTRSLVSASAIVSVCAVLVVVVAVLTLNEKLPPRIGDQWLQLGSWLFWIGIAVVIWKPLPFRVSLPVLVIFSGYVAFLAWDDSEPMPPLQLPPVISEDSGIRIAMSWLTKDDPNSRLSEAILFEIQATPGSDDWAEQVAQRTEEIETNYAKNRLGHDWIEAMAGDPPGGIIKPGGADRTFPSFQAIRAFSKLQWAHSEVLLKGGRTDEAARSLIPFLRAFNNLHRVSPTLVEQMIACVCQKANYMQMQRILDSGAVSQPVRLEIASILREAPPVSENVTFAFIGEHVLARSFKEGLLTESIRKQAFSSTEDSSEPSLPFITKCLVNPNRTLREYSDFLERAEDFAMQRPDSMDGSAGAVFSPHYPKWTLKNSAGYWFMELAIPAFQKVTVQFWKEEDLRLRLLKRLESEPEETKTSAAVQQSPALNPALAAL